MFANETHAYCNMFSLVMVCRTNYKGDFLESNGQKLISINSMVDDIDGISTLNDKPKLITIQAYIGKIFHVKVLFNRNV